ncbi:MAG: hypothetical protein AAF266_07010 [Planctomycetota bacterium]
MSITLAPNAGLSHRLRVNGANNLRQTRQSLERLATGKRINRASDDPAGLVAAEQIRGELTDVRSELKAIGHRRFALNERGSQLSAVADGLIDLQSRINQASSNVISDAERAALQVEVDAAIDAFALVAKEAAPDLRALSTGNPASLDRGDVALASQIVEAESSSVLNQRVTVAAGLRQQEVYENIARDREVILTETLSQIEGTDFAVETSNLATSQALTTAANTAQVYSQQSHTDLIGELLDTVDVEPAAAASGSQ